MQNWKKNKSTVITWIV